MKEEIDKAIRTLTDLVKDNIKADDALKYTQAALNLAHVKQCLKEA